MRQNFWQESWKAVNRDRIAEYGKAISPAPDRIIGILQNYHAKSVCDAGCGFDLSTDAVEIAREHAPTARLKTAEVCSTGYPSGCFDAIVCRDVLDHIGKQDAELAIPELLRILKPGGILIATLDAPDEEYCREAHAVNADGDFVYTGGKWTGMVFHPYSREEIMQIIPPSVRREIMEDGDGFLAVMYHGNPDR